MSQPLPAPAVVPRRTVLGASVCALASIVVSGCAPAQERTDSPWHYGRLYIATGNTTGVFYQIGGGYADIISHHVPGYQATAEPTNAAVENIGRVTRGDCEIGLTFADVAADAISGREPFANDSQDLRAIARIYNNYAHVIVRSGIGIRGVADLRGRRVSTGSPGSGTSSVAVRLLRAVGIDPDRDIVRAPLSLPETVKGMRDGSLDALFWTAGLPTLGIADLMSTMGQTVDFLPVADLYPQLRAVYGGAYTLATIGTDVYGQASDVPTIAVGAMIVVSPEMPESLSYELTRVLYEYQADLAAAHPEGKNFSRASGHLTDPVPLHLGARRYYGCLDEPCQTTTH